ncbi:MAG: S9 family peptidase [Gemmatimonadales bacterium]
MFIAIRNQVIATTIAAVAVVPAAQAQQTFTLEQVMSAPFPSGLVAARSGAKVAWVQNDRGVRNIWVADGPAYEGWQVTSYDADDGQEVSSLEFTPDGGAIVYVRGGAPNRQGEIPNPTSDPDGAERAVWVVPRGGGEPRKLADGSAPRISPKGDIVVFLRRSQVWSVSLDSAGDAKAKQLFRARGRAGSLTWSPDGSMLTFASNRGNHSFIGVYNVANKEVRYLAPSVDRDNSPVWSPDGRRIAFIRTPQQSGVLPFMQRREAEPWSLWVADVATGTGRTVWTADHGPGSVFHRVVGAQLHWGAGDRLVFPWEKDGWVHLYSVSVNGGKATLLTPGEFEVEHVSLSADRRDLIYSSNQGDIDRRHLWRVAVSGGAPRAVTSGKSIEWSPRFAGDGDAIAFLASDARTPAHAVIKVGSRDARALAPQSMPHDFPSDALVEPQQVIFTAADGMQIHGQLFLPKNMRRGERHPALLHFHGGSRRQMLLGWHYIGYYHNAYAENQYLASRGYIVLSVNYRSGIGYGMKFREAINYGARGASEFNDVLGAGLYLKSRPDVDPNRIGLWGGSYGGYLTALGLARASDLFAAGVDYHGVHDWNFVIRNFRQDYNPAEHAAVARLAFESSPMASVKDWRSPVLLIHGDDDRNVPFGETVDLVEQLRKHGVYFEQLIFPDEVHGFLMHKSWVRAYHATAEFFDRQLKGGTTATGGR